MKKFLVVLVLFVLLFTLSACTALEQFKEWNWCDGIKLEVGFTDNVKEKSQESVNTTTPEVVQEVSH